MDGDLLELSSLQIVHGLLPVTDTRLACDLIGFGTGLAISTLLLLFAVRAARLPGTAYANLLFAACAVLWNAGGLAHALLLVLGYHEENLPVLFATAFQFTAAAVWPLPMLIIWRRFSTFDWQRVASFIFECIAVVSAVTISLFMWLPLLTGIELFPKLAVKMMASHNAAVLLTLGFLISASSPKAPRGTRVASAGIVAGVLFTSVAMAFVNSHPMELGNRTALLIVSEHSLLLTVLATFFLFTKFRFADLFIRQSLRILLASATAFTFYAVGRSGKAAELAQQIEYSNAAQTFLHIASAFVLLLIYSWLDRLIGQLVNRWIFRLPNYRLATQRLTDRLLQLHTEEGVGKAAAESICQTLGIEGARLVSIEMMERWPVGLTEGVTVDLDRNSRFDTQLPIEHVEVMVPVSSGGQVSHVLLVSPGPASAGLVTHEIEHLRVTATQCGNRFNALHYERETIERRSREAVLFQQATEAELRALRAQVNPHFLFNSLNTLANLIATDQARAEEMTLRLARVFRHVIANSGRMLTSVSEEMDFLRTYLHIEEARFGERLKVEINVAPEIAANDIPSLILQPLVENALKHGLGPKTGPGRLWIGASAMDRHVRLTIEDDGVGPVVKARSNKNGQDKVSVSNGSVLSAGVGLSNITKRLETIYREEAAIQLEQRESGGTRVTILIPRAAALHSV